MLKSDKLKQQRAAKAEQAQAILDLATDTRPLTAEESAKVAALTAEVKAFGPQIDNQVEIENALRDVPATTAAPVLENSSQAAVVDYSRFRSGALRHFKNEKDAYACGQFLIAAIWGGMPSGEVTPQTQAAIAKSREWCKNNGIALIRDSANEGTNTAGGYLVPSILESKIIDLRDSYGIARKYTDVMPMSSNHIQWSRRVSGLTAYAMNEGTATTESSMVWAPVSLTARKWGVITRYSSEIAEDAVINIADRLVSEIAYAFAVAEDNALFIGDGTSTYQGISGLYRRFFDANVGTFIGAPSAASTHNTWAEIDADDIDTLIGTLPAYARPGAQFYIAPTGKVLVFDPLLRAAGGNTQGDVSNGMPAKYMGYPINEIVALQQVPTYDFDEKPMLYFGHMQLAASMGSRRGMTLATSSDVYFTTDEIAIRGTERFDINVHSIGDGTTAGPLVALIGEAS